MRYLFLGIVLSITAMGETLPVDNEIAELNLKAAKLTALKSILQTNQCSVTYLKNTVKLTAGAMRGQGLVMAIGPSFPGNYLAYQEAPKAELLAQYIENVLKRGGSSTNAIIVEVVVESSPGSKNLDTFEVTTKDPVVLSASDADDFKTYNIRRAKVPVPNNGESISIAMPGPRGQDVTISCN